MNMKIEMQQVRNKYLELLQDLLRGPTPWLINQYAGVMVLVQLAPRL